MTKRVCTDCGDLIDRGPLCSECQSERNRRRPSREQRGYDWTWRAVSARRRRSFPVCELRYDSCQLIAVDVDHRIPIRAGGRSVWSNAQSACRACHAVKTRRDAEEYPRAA